MSETRALLKDFAKQPNCGKAKGSSGSIDVMLEYLYVQQLCPLTFREFLPRYAEAYATETKDPKTPRDLLTRRCPRAASQAAGRRQWTAAEVEQLLWIYIDTVVAAQDAGTPLPVTFAQLLESDIPERFLGGEFDQMLKTSRAAAAPVRESPSTAAADVPFDTPETTATTPWAVSQPPAQPVAPAADSGSADLGLKEGDAVILSLGPAGRSREVRGHLTAISRTDGNVYGTLRADYGEDFPGWSIRSFRKDLSPPPARKVSSSKTVRLTVDQESELTAAMQRRPQPGSARDLMPLATVMIALTETVSFCLEAMWLYDGATETGVPRITASIMRQQTPQEPWTVVATAIGPPRQRFLGVYYAESAGNYYEIVVQPPVAS